MSSVVPLRQGLHLTEITPEQARANGYVCLGPLERQVAIEFATTGHTLKQVALDLKQPLAEVRRAFGNPIVRALIHDMQTELAAHKMVNATWVEQQILKLWPRLIGDEPVNLINKSGEEVSGRKFHGPEVASILKHFGGNKDQKAAGGVQVVINFGDMGVSPSPQVTVIEGELGSDD